MLEERGAFCRFLRVQYAFHSAQMDPIRDELLAALEGIEPRAASLPMFSTVTGKASRRAGARPGILVEQRPHGRSVSPKAWIV